MNRFRRQCRFSLRALLVGMTCFSIWLGLQVNHANCKKRLAAAVAEVGGKVIYQHNEMGTAEKPVTDYSKEPRAPGWLRNLLGDDYFREPTQVFMRPNSKVTDEWLVTNAAHLRNLPKLRHFTLLYNSKTTTNGLCRLGKLTQLESLVLTGTPICDSTLASFAELTALRRLDISGVEITDKGLSHLRELHDLKELQLSNTRLKGGLRPLRHLTNLTDLRILWTPVTDADLESLKSLYKLQYLILQDTQVTVSGVRKLRAALPKCRIELSHGDD